jgi:CxxC motif-containing protein (DUF1111 family)
MATVRNFAKGMLLSAAMCGFDGVAMAQQDPGVRGGPPGAGGPLNGLTNAETHFFGGALARFQAVDSVSGTINDAPSGIINGTGLGPRFNLNSCAGCHAQPAPGGTSPSVNPQIGVATLDGANNTIPSFITTDGPVREVRFKSDGGVHALFTITGRRDAPGCNIAQPDFSNTGDIIFRIPTPVFGLGLVEITPDQNLISDAEAQGVLRQSLGIGGSFNYSGNDGTITRFGWKAQNKSLLMFSGEAYNVEVGVTNELFPSEREYDQNCQYNTLPEDFTNLTNSGVSNSPSSNYASDIVNFAAFARLSAPPAPVPDTPSIANGRSQFMSVGCGACHIQQHTTGQSTYTGQSNVTYFPYTDFQIHDMGGGLADGISQGNASGSQFRTAPLWGAGQRIFFLHDGRTKDLLQAILAHGGEASQVISNFNGLSASQKQDILNFLRGL